MEADLEDRGEVTGDGSTMEEWSRVHLIDLREAIAMCRDGRVPDMKTEVALLRLADHLGYIHQLDAFADDLPPELRERFTARGIERLEGDASR